MVPANVGASSDGDRGCRLLEDVLSLHPDLIALMREWLPQLKADERLLLGWNGRRR